MPEGRSERACMLWTTIIARHFRMVAAQTLYLLVAFCHLLSVISAVEGGTKKPAQPRTKLCECAPWRRMSGNAKTFFNAFWWRDASLQHPFSLSPSLSST